MTEACGSAAGVVHALRERADRSGSCGSIDSRSRRRFGILRAHTDVIAVVFVDRRNE